MGPKATPKSGAKDDMDGAQAVKNKKTPKKVTSDDDDEEDFDEEDDEEEEDDEDDEDIDEDDEDFDEENEADDSKIEKSVVNLRKTLFIKNLPESTTEAEIKALSPDILEVRIDVSHLKGEKNPKYAILDFADGDKAARTLEQLKGQPINGADVIIDFISGKGSAASYTLPANSPSDLCKLYVTGFGREISMELLKQMFPTSSDISLPLNPKDGNKPLGYAFIHYTDEGVCKAAHDAMQDHVYQSRTLVVMYGKKSSLEADKSGKRSQPPPRRGLDS